MPIRVINIVSILFLFFTNLIGQEFDSILVSANQGDPVSQYQLGLMYHKGIGIDENQQKAAYWFRKSSEQGNSDAQTYMGFLYLTGKGVEKNNKEAYKWFEKSALQGNKSGEYYLANLYYVGTGVDINMQKALNWYSKSANQGHSKAQYYLAVMYDNGVGVKENKSQAAYWFLQSAKQGDSDAQFNIATMYLFGDGVEMDKEMAFQWFQKSAEQEDESAQYSLGIMYFKGEGTTQNIDSSYIWLKKAMINGSKEAQTFWIKNRLDSYKKSSSDIVTIDQSDDRNNGPNISNKNDFNLLKYLGLILIFIAGLTISHLGLQDRFGIAASMFHQKYGSIYTGISYITSLGTITFLSIVFTSWHIVSGVVLIFIASFFLKYIYRNTMIIGLLYIILPIYLIAYIVFAIIVL